MNEENFETTGFDAITNKLAEIYPEQEPRHYGTVVPYALGGNDPLDGISVYKNEKGIPHWHYISYGLTELYEKESEIEEESGWGFELTFRLKCGDEEEPPTWPMNLMQNLARYVFSSGNVFSDGHHMSCNGPIALEEETKLTAFGFILDPELEDMDTENGYMEFIQMVGITEDEMHAMMCWNGDSFMEIMDEKYPLCVTDLFRDTIMEEESVVKKWKEGVERDGSSTAYLYLDELNIEKADGDDNYFGTLCLGAGHTSIISTMLKARLGKGRELIIRNRNIGICFNFDEKNAIGMEEPDFTVIILNNNALEELCAALQPHAGVTYLKRIPLILKIVPTYIKDNDGNMVEVIE